MRELIGFDGAVECLAAEGPVNLVLRGFERRRDAARSRHRAAALFSGARPPAGAARLPARLDGPQLFELEDAAGRSAPRTFLLRAGELQLEFDAAGLQLQRDAGDEFFAAVPPLSVPWQARWGWTLLLTLLRVPGAGRLLARLRGGR